MIIVLLALCAALAPPVPSPATQPSVVRGHDPWVFRCALDRRPRMVVVALTPGWWLAFDAARGTIYKAWEGDVHFTGTVYDTRHGPQPEAIGETFFEGEPIRIVKSSGDPAFDVKWQWRGYRFADGEVELNIGATAPDGREITVAISPRVVERDGRAASIRLVLTPTGLGPGERAVLTLGGVDRGRVVAGRINASHRGGDDALNGGNAFPIGRRFEFTFGPAVDGRLPTLDLEIADP